MIPKEILRKVRQIQIRTTHLVDAVFSGQYESVFKGRGIEFEEVREYQPGDEVSTIDWNVTARMGRPYIKKYVEERELTILLAVDLSASGHFGSVERIKNELAAELCAVLAFSAVRNNDKVGLLIFTDRVEKFIPPKKGKRHVLRVIREVLWHSPAHTGTDLGAALDYIGHVLKRRTIVFLVSDFIAEGFTRALQVTGKRHDVVAVCLEDPREAELPAKAGLIRLRDEETGEDLCVDTGHEPTRRLFAQKARQARLKRDQIFASCGIDLIPVTTDRPYMGALLKFFKTRNLRRSR